jgi:hypothetical protein
MLTFHPPLSVIVAPYESLWRSQFVYGTTYLIIVIFLVAAIASIHFTNAALRAGTFVTVTFIHSSIQ